ncbi:uncharacterized protein LOC123514672 isoform X2 [Portunus trituberculatus]|uniref:uncharacterized protein LOC123514672 isoform X2 n=1 Tax=Portunus trituberculatus TaxID=210409 RepID=UPI001E1CF378|nr:uncharacterized protein LOC123514672 isoform X2 [Portunus trituberculatus]
MCLVKSQVRNWFTDRRVDNKKAGIYPRDRPLTDCHYCNIFLKTEAERKTHLFASSHVKKILGPEYCGGGGGGGGSGGGGGGGGGSGGVPSESIKWKKLPKTVNAVSSVSGARILAVGFSAEEGEKEQEKKKMETEVGKPGKPTNSKELKKLWTDAMLLSEKEQPAADWDSAARVGGEKSLHSRSEPCVQGKRDTTYTLRMADLKEKLAVRKQRENMCDKKVSSGRDFPVPFEVGVPSNISDNVPVTVNSATTTASAAVSSHDPGVTNTGVVSSPLSGNLHLKKHPQTEDMSALLESEMPRKVSASGKKHNAGEKERPITLSAEVLCKAYKGNLHKLKTKSKSTSSKSGFLKLSNISRETTSSKSSMISIQDMEMKQEHVPDDSVNNTTVYKSDVSDGQSKREASLVNASKQSSLVNQNVSGSPKNLQKTSAVTHDISQIRSRSGLAVNKISRIIDKRKDKVRTQPLGSVLKASKATSAYEGNIIVGYQCPNCNKVYQTEWLMIKHSVTHFKYHCDICYKTYPTENMMKIHLLDHLTGAYEDEKYYCQFSCKICHSLKCGCYEPTYCKPQDLPRLFLRPQKARRSKRGFVTKLNSGPNDHLKISLSSYKKLLLSESLGNVTKEKIEKASPPRTMFIQDTKKPVENDQKPPPSSVADSPKKVIVFREVHKPNTPTETPKVLTLETESKECISVKVETTPAFLTKDRHPMDSVASVSGEQVKVKPVITTVEKDIILAREKQQNWNRMKRKLALSYEREVTPSPQPPCPSKSEETEEAPGSTGSTKRGGGRRRTTKHANNFAYNDTDFYYMCEICDASFTCKAELSEHMFLHRLKSRSRGEKRGIAWAPEEKVPKKVKVSEVQVQTSKPPPTATESHTCKLCHITFAKMADYYAHKIMAHNKTPQQQAQTLEVFRCNYCDKIYRRRRELKRHLKRDCTNFPSSLKGELLRAASNNVIEEAHYTTMNIDLDEKLDTTPKFVSRGASRGPIICKYCLAVTKREAEMKRHIWKFCLKVPADVVKKFMDGASLEELGFKYIREEAAPTQDSPTDSPQSSHTDISRPQSAVEESLDEIHSVQHSESSTASSPNKQNSSETKSFVMVEPSETIPTEHSSQLPPHQTTSHVQESTSPEPNIVEDKTLTVHSVLEESQSEKVIEMETTDDQPQPVSSEKQSLSTVPAQESVENKPEEQTPVESSPQRSQPHAKQSLIKPQPKETKAASSGGGGSADEVAQTAASTSPLASPVMQFPRVVPVMTTSQKSKRPLVCGYCGIWYFREMAILKHMKERCIKIPEFEKNFLIHNSSLCNVAQKVGGANLATDNGAVYKMVKMPEHMQNTPVLVPKDVTNEDIKELNKNIKAYSESTPTEAKPSVNERVEVVPVLGMPAGNQTRSTPSKRGSRCRRCHEHFSSQEAVLAHSSVHHGPKKGYYKCKLCHARLLKYKQLREHVWEHTNENPYRCHLCQVRYRSSDSLIDHLLTKHQFTSINDKNLYKWLPGRHGKYRDIKTKVTDCEEKLDDMDTNLDSVAEVMFITDKDICSEGFESKDTKDGSEKPKQSEGDNKNLLANSTSDKNSHENSCLSNESKTPPESSSSSSNHTFVNNAISENITADKTDALKEGKRNAKESSRISCDNSSVKQPRVQGESKDEEQTLPAESLTVSKSKNGGEQKRDSVSKGTDTDQDAEFGTIDSYHGEGLLPLVDNLDSVVETIQLTDKHLS